MSTPFAPPHAHPPDQALVALAVERLRAIEGLSVLAGGDVAEAYSHDEALTATPHRPAAVVAPASTAEVSAVLRVVHDLGCPVTTRGAGTGLAGGCIPPEGGVVLSTERMARVLELGIPDEVQAATAGYLMIGLEEHRADRLGEDVARMAELVTSLGALDVYVLPPGPSAQLLDAREKAFWVVKRNGAHDIIDVVVPRASMPQYLALVGEMGQRHGVCFGRAGHAGDGNVHLSVFEPDVARRKAFLREVFSASAAMGGVVSAEHGIGTEKVAAFLELEGPTTLGLLRGIKAAFDPKGILNPGVLFGWG